MHSVAASADLDGWRAQVCLSALLSLGGTPCDFVRLRKSSTPRASSAVLVKLEVRRTGDSGGGAPAAADGSSPAIWLGRDRVMEARHCRRYAGARIHQRTWWKHGSCVQCCPT